MRRTLRAPLLACGLPLLGGCLAARPNETGVRIGDETLAQFKAGVTTEAWLVAILGEPSSVGVVEDVANTRVYRYSTGERAGGLGSLLSGPASRNTAVVYFIITDGIVTRFWADRAVEYTVLGKPVEQPAGEKLQ